MASAKRKQALDTAEEISGAVKKLPKWERSRWPKKGQIEVNAIHQADLLFMPLDDDGGFRYILVVVDVGSRKLAARPLTEKAAETVAKAFKDIYRKKELEWPSMLQVDAGSEFKSKVTDLMNEHDVTIRRGKPNRHTQQAIVEGNNRVIAKYLFHEMLADEIQTKKLSTTWASRLQSYVQKINKVRADVLDSKPVPVNEPSAPSDKLIELLPEGAKVRYALDFPIDYVTKKKTDASFRTGDVRWSEPTTIDVAVIIPGYPPRYIVKGMDGVSYARNQLKLVN